MTFVFVVMLTWLLLSFAVCAAWSHFRRRDKVRAAQCRENAGRYKLKASECAVRAIFADNDKLARERELQMAREYNQQALFWEERARAWQAGELDK